MHGGMVGHGKIILPSHYRYRAGRRNARSAPPTTTTINFATPRPPQMEPVDAALAAIQVLEPGEKLVYTQIAKRYGVERTTLARRH
jgi:hypothetical protein